jgi:hypothetical protein
VNVQQPKRKQRKNVLLQAHQHHPHLRPPRLRRRRRRQQARTNPNKG